MTAASLFGLLSEGLGHGTPLEVGVGAAAGVLLVVVAHRVIESDDVSPEQYEQADFETLLLILGILTVHSFPEGVAVGVSFADLTLDRGVPVAGVTVPLLAVFMTVAISIHNVPEGVAVSIPLRSLGVPTWRLVWRAVFSSIPQPIGAVLAFWFVSLAETFRPYRFGFAAGAMLYLVADELLPEALELGEGLPRGGVPELAAGFLAGVAAMTPLLFI